MEEVVWYEKEIKDKKHDIKESSKKIKLSTNKDEPQAFAPFITFKKIIKTLIMGRVLNFQIL